MKKLLFAALAAASIAPVAAHAQDGASRLEPYVGVLGGYEKFNDHWDKTGIPPMGYDSATIEGVAGVNYNVAGPIVIGVEGNVAKGISGDVDWQYGVTGRAGVKAGKDSLIYGAVGYRWTNFSALGNNSPDFHGTTYGFGAEVSPADLGGSAEKSNMRLRLQVDTLGNFNTFRPMAGLVVKY